MGFYTGAVPEELERLKPEERRGVYRMLRLEVSASSDGTLEARGVLVEGLRVGSEDGGRFARLNSCYRGSRAGECREIYLTTGDLPLGRLPRNRSTRPAAP
jgi:hypothetical protein